MVIIDSGSLTLLNFVWICKLNESTIFSYVSKAIMLYTNISCFLYQEFNNYFFLQNLISDIEGHKGKALFVLQKHAELHAQVGEDIPLHNTKLAAEINTLLQQAHTDCDELRDAVAQQDQYESEMRQLTKSIKDAQEKLLGSPIQASSVETLKQQITERNVCTRTGFVKIQLEFGIDVVSPCPQWFSNFHHSLLTGTGLTFSLRY